MELSCQPDGGGAVMRIGLDLEIHMLLQALDVRARDFFRKPDKDLALQAHPRLEHVLRLRKARLGDGGSLVRLHVDETFGMEPRQCCPDDRAADAEPVADHILGQLVARHQGLLDDRAAKAGIDRIASGAGG